MSKNKIVHTTCIILYCFLYICAKEFTGNLQYKKKSVTVQYVVY